MAAANQIESRPDHRLTIDEVLDDLVEDGLIERPVAQGLLFTVTPKDRADRHALELVADGKLHHAGSSKRIITLEELTFWLAKRTGLEYLRIDPLKIDAPNVGDLVTASYATWNRILPVAITPERVVFATSEPYLTGWIDELGGIIKREIVRVMANPRDIERYRKEFFGVSRSVKGATTTEGNKRFLGLGNLEALVELGKSGQIDANDSHIVHIVDWLLQYAFDQRASDIHLEPRREVGNIRFRIDGVMHPVYQVPALVMTAVTSRIKILGRMDVAEKRRPQDGRIKTRSEDGRELEMRLSTMPTAFGEKLVMRIFNPDVLLRNFTDLGFGEEDAKRWQAMVARPHGIILVTGPTGSGKTTTLYSTLKTLATPQVNVCTVEEPIEMVEPAFNQMQVPAQHRAGLRQRHPHPDAPGPGHHHGRRDPRPGDRGDGGPGVAHRPPGPVHPAHQRCPVRDHPPAGHRRTPLSDQGDRHRRGRPTPGAHPLPPLQAGGPGRPGPVGVTGQSLEDSAPRRPCGTPRAAWSAAIPATTAASGSTRS